MRRLILWCLVLLMPLSAWAAREDGEGVYDGQLLPRDFLPLSTPTNSLKLPFWRSISGSIQIADVLPEGTTVTAGQIVASFVFNDTGALGTIQQRLAQLEAKAQEADLRLAKRIQELETALGRARIHAAVAALNLKRGRSLAKVKFETLQQEARRLAFEQQALTAKLQAARENRARSRALSDQQIQVWHGFQKTFEQTRQRYQMRAPVGGVLFYPVVAKLQRKVQKGDELPTGMHFLSIVRSERVSLQFSVPEADLERIGVGTALVVKSGRKRAGARVTAVGFFPQLIGDLMDDFKRPDAWDKCFLVEAELKEPLPLGSTNLVKVKVRP